MGYTTDFDGQFDFDKPLTMKQYVQLKEFSSERHEELCMPGYWCQWIPTHDGEALEWDGGEKFYEYTRWLEYLIEKFFKPWDIVLNGEVKWMGRQREDIGIIYIKDNRVQAVSGYITSPEPDWSE